MKLPERDIVFLTKKSLKGLVVDFYHDVVKIVLSSLTQYWLDEDEKTVETGIDMVIFRKNTRIVFYIQEYLMASLNETFRLF